MRRTDAGNSLLQQQLVNFIHVVRPDYQFGTRKSSWSKRKSVHGLSGLLRRKSQYELTQPYLNMDGLALFGRAKSLDKAKIFDVKMRCDLNVLNVVIDCRIGKFYINVDSSC